ncbi:hypothetical protein V7O62_03895 [Methanolobus sp. ZRKC2]|uniref:hypothetical protein n=1 Tax=Methanolobus sp. ZRKC2 TaxID=3125783 RepID=UPI00324DE7AF
MSQSPEEAVEYKVNEFLDAVNKDEVGIAYDMYRGKDFLAPASIGMIFSNKGIDPGSINEINIVSKEIVGNLAILKVDCGVSSLDLMGKEKDSSVIPIYFRLQDTEIGWIITRVSFHHPLEFEDAELVDIEVEKTSIDLIADNAVVISLASFSMLGAGLYLNRKDKSKKKDKKRTIDTSDAVLLPKESLSQYVKLVPAQQIQVGNKTTVDVWVKNFAQQPYENFAIKAKFGNTVDVESTNLFFDTIASGETAKKTWVVKPKVSGWASIEEPTVVFEYMGARYMGVLDPVWLQVQ